MDVDGTDVASSASVTGSNPTYCVTYMPPAPQELGEHTVYVRVTNTYNLEDGYNFAYRFTTGGEGGGDADGDGMGDEWEETHGGDLEPGADNDGDGLNNHDEYRNDTDPQNRDSDGGGIPDGQEVSYGYNPLDPSDDDPCNYGPCESPPPGDTPPSPNPPPASDSGGDVASSDGNGSTVVVGHDPNEMTGPEGQVFPGQPVCYTVKFENTGEGKAFGVYVTDALEEKIDDTSVVVSNCVRIDYETGAETPADFAYHYSPATRLLSVFIDNEGEVGPKQGGKFDINVRIDGGVTPGQEIVNFATVYFPSVPEETRTNSIVSVVPDNTVLGYYGTKVVEYGDPLELRAVLSGASSNNLLAGKQINFTLEGINAADATENSGAVYSVMGIASISPGEYAMDVSFDGDIYNLPSRLQQNIRIAKSRVTLTQPYFTYYSTGAGVFTANVSDNQGRQLFRQAEEPKTVYLEYKEADTWKTLAAATVSGSSVTFSFDFLPEKDKYFARVRFDGDACYLPAREYGTIEVAMPGDAIAPQTTVEVAGPGYISAGKIYIGEVSTIVLNSGDTGSGVGRIEYSIDSSSGVYSAPLMIGHEGGYVLSFFAIGLAGNAEEVKRYDVIVDTTPPVSGITVSDSCSQVTDGGSTYINSHAGFNIEVVDPLSGGVASGAERLEYAVDDGATVTMRPEQSGLDLSYLADGLHTVGYYAIDNVGNTEPVKTFSAFFDGTRPCVASTWPGDMARVHPRDADEIKVTFSEPVTSADWRRDVVVAESKGRKAKDFAMRYDTATFTLTICGKLKNNTNYDITISSAISDRVGNMLEQYHFSFRTCIKASEGATIEDDETGLKIVIPPNSLPCDGYCETGFVEMAELPRIAYPMQWLLRQKAYFVLFKDMDDGLMSGNLERPLTITCSINAETETPGPQGAARPFNMRFYRIGNAGRGAALVYGMPPSGQDTEYQSPALLGSAQCADISERRITAQSPSFGVFCVAGFLAPESSLDDLSGYPSPFNPDRQSLTIQYYMLSDSDVTIAIYDLLGNLVKTWDIASGGINARTGLNQLVWDGRNGRGDIVSNGGYIIFVRADGRNKKFKVLVVK